MIKAIYFDLDGVLFNRDEAEKNTLEYINEHYLNTIELKSLFTYWKQINRNLWVQCSNECITAEQVLIKRWSEMISLIGLKKNISSEDLSEVYIEKYTSPIYKIDLTNILEILKSRKYFLSVITNGVKRTQHLKLNNMNLTKYFDYIITDQDSGYRKPDVGIFKYALSLYNVNAKEAIYIGDSYSDDIVPSKYLGFTSILYGSNSIKIKNSSFYKANNESALQMILKKLLRLAP